MPIYQYIETKEYLERLVTRERELMKNRNTKMKKTEKISALGAQMNNPEFIMKSRCAIYAVQSKLEIINEELWAIENRNSITNIESRIKQPESICAKLMKKGCDVNFENAYSKLNDIIGVRGICAFMDDIYHIADELKERKDLTVLKEKDYIKNPKPSGYRSLHLILEVPIYYAGDCHGIRVELQLRTTAMDFWAGLDHQLRYKKKNKESEWIGGELKKCAWMIREVDERMQQLRNEINAIS